MIKWIHYKLNGNQEDYKLNFDILLMLKAIEGREEYYNYFLKEIESENLLTTYFTGDPR